MSRISKWESVRKNKFTNFSEEKDLSYLVYKLSRLPDFSDERFTYLNKEIDNRSVEVAKKQL